MTTIARHFVVLICALLLASASASGAAKKNHLKGKIVAVHAEKKTVELEKKSGELQTFYITDTTRYVMNQKPMTLADLKRDAKVSVHYTLKEGKMIATKVVISDQKKSSKRPTPAAVIEVESTDD